LSLPSKLTQEVGRTHHFHEEQEKKKSKSPQKKRGSRTREARLSKLGGRNRRGAHKNFKREEVNPEGNSETRLTARSGKGSSSKKDRGGRAGGHTLRGGEGDERKKKKTAIKETDGQVYRVWQYRGEKVQG